jgi:hypothetical protein
MIAEFRHFHGPQQSKIVSVPGEEFDESIEIQDLR